MQSYIIFRLKGLAAGLAARACLSFRVHFHHDVLCSAPIAAFPERTAVDTAFYVFGHYNPLLVVRIAAA